MKKLILTLTAVVLLAATAAAQPGKKPWTEWSPKDAEKMLTDSAWAQTQTEGGSAQTSSSVVTPTASSGNSGRDIQRQGESGEGRAPQMRHYRVRFLSAKPIREAFMRIAMLSQVSPSKEYIDQLQSFVDRDFGNFLVVTLSVDASDPKMSAGAMAGFTRLTLDSLKDKVYLERKDGKKLSLMDYKPPINDGLGAKFIFDRTVDGQPFLNEDSDSVRFYMEMGKSKVSLKFKVKDMLYGGKLEY